MPPLSQAEEKLWTPQLRPYDHDAAVLKEGAFAEAFEVFKSRTQTRTRESSLLLLLDPVLAEPQWVQYLSDWLAYCLGGELVDHMPGDAIARSRQLFLNVLWTRQQHAGNAEGDAIATSMLLKAQMKNFRAYGHIPADFCWVDDIDRRETWDGDSDAGERASDWEDCSDVETEDPMDEDFRPPSPPHPQPTSLEEPPELVSFLQSREKPIISVLPTKPRLPPVSMEDDELPLHWALHMQQFFFSPPENTMSNSNEAEVEPRSAVAVVDDLVHMRLIRQSRYNSKPFQQALQASLKLDSVSRLLDLMHYICRAGNLIETMHPDVEESFRWHDWKTSYAELYCRWIPATLTQIEYDATLPCPDPKYKFSPKDAMGLLEFMSSHPRMLPWSSNPMAVFLFLSLACFIANCETWLIPCLRELGYPRIEGWNSQTIHRRLLDLGAFIDPESHQTFMKRLDPRLALIIKETSAHRIIVRKVYKAMFRTRFPKPSSHPSPLSSDDASDFSEDEVKAESAIEERKLPQLTKGQIRKEKSKASKAASTKNTVLGRENDKREAVKQSKKRRDLRHKCPYCADLPMEEQCVRVVYVKPRECHNLIGAALTCAPPADRLKPKPPAKRKKGSKSKVGIKRRPRIRYLHPFDDLKMELIVHRPEVYRRCRKDVVRFVWEHDGLEEMVGGVRFKAFSKKILAQLVVNHRRVAVQAIRRREAMEAWAYGTMTAGGSRQPMGGRRGDGYGPYSCHRGDTPDDIKALFRHAVDNDILVEAGSTIYPPMKTELASTSESDVGAADLKEGRARNSYEGGLYPCAQLEKTNCGPHDYNFAYVRWGLVKREPTLFGFLTGAMSMGLSCRVRVQ
ncbi:hypothetical protein B0H11DRAFT_2226884 [Mycena galericulata]|nr:hypothetical protein B0H11DRAFT_2226884 [Mycena galericulata]